MSHTARPKERLVEFHNGEGDQAFGRLVRMAASDCSWGNSVERQLQMPPSFICSICMNPMLDPVSVEFGHSYCRGCIGKWLQSGKRTNPRDGRCMSTKKLVDNVDLRQAVESMLEAQEPFCSTPRDQWQYLLDSCLFQGPVPIRSSRCPAEPPGTINSFKVSLPVGCPNPHEDLYYLDAAHRGDPLAQLRLAVIYAGADEPACKLWRKAAFKHPPEAIEHAVKALAPSAHNGDADKQHLLGWCYGLGWGVPRNRDDALEWFRRSAARGHAGAQFVLGWKYLRFFGGNERAVQWFEKSAKQGFCKAQAILAICYSLGLGVKKDDEEHTRWYKKAAELGFVPAYAVLGEVYEVGCGAEVDLAEAERWYRKGAEKGDHFALAACYENGWGVERDLKAAMREYRSAKKKGWLLEKCRTELQRKVFPQWEYKLDVFLLRLSTLYPPPALLEKCLVH